jgi:hypothetical protein
MTMQLVTSVEPIKELLADERAPAISLVMPTYKAGREVEQNRIRYRNLLREAISKLVERGESEHEAEQRLAPLMSLEYDDNFWQHQSLGLAIYLSNDVETMVSLNYSPEAAVFVDDHFYVVPIAMDATKRLKYTVLALTWKDAELFSADRTTLESLESDLFPVASSDIILPADREDQLQYRSQGVGAPAAMVHGQGAGENMIESDRRRFISEVGKRLNKELGTAKERLILVATEEVAAQLIWLSDIKPVRVVSASPDGMPLNDLRERVLASMAEKAKSANFGEQIVAAEAAGQGSRDIAKILEAAVSGRVAKLFIDPGSRLYGTWDPDQLKSQVTGETGHTELINLAVLLTLRCGGQVEGMEANEQGAGEQTSGVAAIYRY